MQNPKEENREAGQAGNWWGKFLVPSALSELVIDDLFSGGSWFVRNSIRKHL